MRKKKIKKEIKTNTVSWRCPVCERDWISTIEPQVSFSFGRCHNCYGVFEFTEETKKTINWKYIDDEIYDDPDKENPLRNDKEI